MQKEQQLICIVCPLGCRVRLTLDNKGNIVEATGNECKKGKEYAESECKNPVRVLTGTVLTEGSKYRTLAIRTNKPIPKAKLIEVYRSLAGVKAKPPVKVGQAIVRNVLKVGADIVATDELPA